jgi:hypothetical protein
MPVAPKLYRRVSGRTTNFTGYHRLYEGPDHLLLVCSTGFREDYRRFFYRDLQAVIIRPTNRRRGNAIAWGAFTAVTGLPALATALAGVPVLAIVLGVLAAIFGGILALNHWLGPTCECHLQTAVQCEPLPALRRLNRVQKFLAQIRARVGEVQGALAPEELAARLVVAGAATRVAEADLPPVIGAESPPAT